MVPDKARGNLGQGRLGWMTKIALMNRFAEGTAHIELRAVTNFDERGSTTKLLIPDQRHVAEKRHLRRHQSAASEASSWNVAGFPVLCLARTSRFPSKISWEESLHHRAGPNRSVERLTKNMMTDVRILLSPPHLGEEERRLVEAALESNWIAPVGPDVNAFERELAETVGTEHACALSSGTAAIHLALHLLGVSPGDLVICSSLTFVASANPILMCGAEPVFVDSDPDTWCISVSALERALRKLAKEGRTPRACIAVSLYGQAAELPEIAELCKQYDVKLLDEAAESLGATHGEHMAGTFGDLGVYSFNGNKIITTSGGGALVSNNGEMIERARFLAAQARNSSPISAYEHTEQGFNYRLSNILAAIGRGQLQVLAERVEARRKVFARYQEQLSGIRALSWMPEPNYGRATRWLTCCLLSQAEERDPLVHCLRNNSVDARPVWKPMHLQRLFKETRFFEHAPGQDVSANLFERGLCLPSGSNLSTEQQSRVIDIIRTQLDA